MSTTTFRDFIAEVDRIGDLKLLEGCDWDLEIGTLTELMAERWGPALLFEKIKGYPDGFRVLANPYSTPGRTTLGLDLPLDTKPLEVVNQFRMKLKNFKPIKPIEVNNGPVMENIQERNISVVPTSPPIAKFIRKNRRYKSMLPVGLRI